MEAYIPLVGVYCGICLFPDMIRFQIVSKLMASNNFAGRPSLSLTSLVVFESLNCHSGFIMIRRHNIHSVIVYWIRCTFSKGARMPSLNCNIEEKCRFHILCTSFESVIKFLFRLSRRMRRGLKSSFQGLIFWSNLRALFMHLHIPNFLSFDFLAPLLAYEKESLYSFLIFS